MPPPSSSAPSPSAPPIPPSPSDADILNSFDASFTSIVTANSTTERAANQTYTTQLSKRPITNTEIQAAKTGYANTLISAISDIEQFKTDLASQNFTNSDKSKGKIKNLNTRADTEIVKLNAKITAKGTSVKDLENDALESTPEKKLDKIKKELEKNGDGLNALYLEIAKKIKDKDGAGRLSDEEKSYYTLKLKNYKAEVTTQSIEMAALTASGAVIRQDLLDLVNDNVRSIYNGTGSGDLVSKITELLDKKRDSFTSPDKKLDGVVEKMEGVSLALLTIDAEIKAKVADPANVGGLTAVQKRLFYIRALNQKSVLVKQITEINSLKQAGYNNITQISLAEAYETNIKGMFESIENGLEKKKELDFEKDLKIVDIKIVSAAKHLQEANSLTKSFVESSGNKLTFMQAIKMRISGKTGKEIGKEQIDRAPTKKIRRSEVRQALNGYKKAYRDLYFAFEKIEKLYHSDAYENLSTEDRERVYQKMKEIKEEQKLINDTVGAMGDALPSFAKGMLKGERFADWIGYKWSKKPETDKNNREKVEADWKKNLPPLVDPIILSDPLDFLDNNTKITIISDDTFAIDDNMSAPTP